MYIQKMGPVLVRLAKEMAERQDSITDDPNRADRTADGKGRTPRWFFRTLSGTEKVPK